MCAMHTQLTPQRENYLLLTLAGIQFSHILDFMIMMPLGPILIKAFGISTHEFGLLVASYSFSAALSGLLAATFIDRFERKRLLLTIFGLFGLATLACGLAPGYVDAADRARPGGHLRRGDGRDGADHRRRCDPVCTPRQGQRHRGDCILPVHGRRCAAVPVAGQSFPCGARRSS